MKIGVTTTIREIYKNQFEYSIDQRLIKFLNKSFLKPDIRIIFDNKINLKKFDLLIISGGNDLNRLKKSKRNFLRESLDKNIITKSIKLNIPLLGICYGAQLISSYYGNKIIKQKGRNKKKNQIKFKKSDFFNVKSMTIKSFYNFAIKIDKNILEVLATSKNNCIEAFKIKKEKIYGIMWHPERDRSFKQLNKKFFKKICS
tara:strand:+ start:199 stop:801 length:603 start_codon:yes stop_codon:yes gene_type:complete